MDGGTQKSVAETKLGKKEVLISGTYYDVSKWIKVHPGGRVIDYYTQEGEDATIPFQQFHLRSMDRVLKVRDALPKRDDDGKGEDHLTLAFLKLHQEFEDEGMFKPHLPHVALRLTEPLLWLALAHYCEGNSLWWRLGQVLCMALTFARVVWLFHEGGHCSLTGNPTVDKWIQAFVYGFGNGLSISWWNNQHQKHHAMPQRIGRDVDLDTLPLLAFTSRILSRKSPMSKWLQYQAILFLPVTTLLVIIRWTFDLHPRYCYHKRRVFEPLVILLHFLYFISQFGLLHFLLAKWLWAMYMFGNFSLSHTPLEATEERLHWIQYAFQHTMNISATPLVTWWMGYLNFQIEHHLFPTMPQFRGPKIKERVRRFAEENGLPYRCVGYWEAVGMTLRNLHNVGNDKRKE